VTGFSFLQQIQRRNDVAAFFCSIVARQKAGRSWHHHSCALRRRLIGAGGITGCRDYAQAPNSFPAFPTFFAVPNIFPAHV
jgi:uncharacterized MAPEG superfamily protein